MKTALITGIEGQDGQYLAELLLEKGYKVHGLTRRKSTGSAQQKGVTFHQGDLLSQEIINDIVNKIQPDEIYNLASQSHVGTSFDLPEYTAEVTGLGVLRILEAARHYAPKARIYQASTSELFGNAPAPQNEQTPFQPKSPYGTAKLYAHETCKVYRESYGMFIACGILFNHESPRRGLDFVTRKITNGLFKIRTGQQEKIKLGNLEAKRDWGHAKDYVRAMWMMLQQDKPGEFVIATGESHTVRDFVEKACAYFNLDPEKVVEVSPEFFRPLEVNHLEGDATKAERELGWKREYTFDSLIEEMCQYEH